MNKYEKQGIVGEGAYGVVIKCKNKDTGEIVAIKKFKEAESEEQEAIIKKTSLSEIKMLKSLKQDNIVRLLEAFRRNKRLYLIFEFLDSNLLDIIELYPGGLPLPLIRSLVYQILLGIDFMHKLNIIHRDLKPENLLVNRYVVYNYYY